MKLPNGDRAHVDLDKLVGYCLSPDHPRGRHKARVFASVLGLTVDDAAELRRALLVAAAELPAGLGETDAYGRRYVLDFEMIRAAKSAMVRSSWIVRTDEDFPRLTSCYVL